MASSSSSQPGFLSAARYGKDLVRVARVVREGDTHYVAEYTVRIMLEGEIETSYTKADNSCVVATDSMKNTVYVFAKTSPHVLNPPLFALHLSLHMLSKYSHISRSYIDILSHKWTRISVDGKPHGWAFERNGDEKGTVSIVGEKVGANGEVKASVNVGLTDLLVMKTGGSAFEDFYRDEFTTLGNTADRIFSTTVSLNYNVALPKDIELSIENLAAIGKEVAFEKIAESTRQISLEVFATDSSASVQATMYNTAQKVLTANSAITDVSYSYPNKHYIPVNLAPFNLENGLGPEGGAEVFHPVADPSGLITATVTRS